MSPVSLALYNLLRRLPDDLVVQMEELTITLHCSRTRIRNAFLELEESNLLTYTQES